MSTRSYCRPLFLTLVIAAISARSVEAQVLTLIPTEVMSSNKKMTITVDEGGLADGMVAMTFQPSPRSLPDKAVITRATLVARCRKAGSQIENINVYVRNAPLTEKENDLLLARLQKLKWQDDKTKTDNNLIFLSSATVDDTLSANAAQYWVPTGDNWKLLDLAKGFTLILGTSGEDRDRTWFGLDPENPQLQPRLILEYTVPDQPVLTQPFSVRSRRDFLPSPLATSYGTRDMLTGVTWSYAPAFHDGFVYLMTDDKGKKSLSWRRPLEELTATPIDLTDPGQHLLMSKAGHVYIVGKGKIIAYKIGSDGKPELRSTVKVEGLNPDQYSAPTLGLDGSIFYVHRTFVVGRNPDLQELWKATISTGAPGVASRVTLGPSGQFVYLATANGGLVTVDARSGALFTNPLINQAALNSSIAPVLHAPVVMRKGDGVEKVYVAASSVDDGVLELFNNAKTTMRTDKDQDDEAWNRKLARFAIARPMTLNGKEQTWKTEKGSYGQPLISNDTKQVYVVRRGRDDAFLLSLDWENGKTNTVSAVGREDALWKIGNLATDQSGNVILWDGNLKCFGPSLQKQFDEKLDVDAGSSLFFGTDGSLFVGTIDANARLRTIIPEFDVGRLGGSTIISSTHLRLRGTERTGKPMTVQASGTVLFGKDFSMKQGSTLTVQRPAK